MLAKEIEEKSFSLKKQRKEKHNHLFDLKCILMDIPKNFSLATTFSILLLINLQTREREKIKFSQ